MCVSFIAGAVSEALWGERSWQGAAAAVPPHQRAQHSLQGLLRLDLGVGAQALLQDLSDNWSPVTVPVSGEKLSLNLLRVGDTEGEKVTL